MTDPEIVEYVNSFHEKIRERQLEHFWVLCDRSDFKTHKGVLFEDMEKMFRERKGHYAGKKAAEINVRVAKGRDTDLIRIGIRVLMIGNDGNMLTSSGKAWSSTVIFRNEDLKVQKVTIQLIERLMRALAAKAFKATALFGLSYSEVLEQLAKKKMKLEDFDPKSKD